MKCTSSKILPQKSLVNIIKYFNCLKKEPNKYMCGTLHILFHLTFTTIILCIYYRMLHTKNWKLRIGGRQVCLTTKPTGFWLGEDLPLYWIWDPIGLDPTSKLEKPMAPHSSTLAWKIPWTEEPGRLKTMGSRRVGHDWATSLSLFPFMHWRRKWQPTPVFLAGEFQGWGSLVGRRLWGCTESDTTEVT